MPENKTKPTKVSVAAFIDAVPDPAKREDAKVIAKMMQKASGEKPAMWGPSIIGFGTYHYVYATGREGDMPLIAFSPRKAATVLYGLIGFPGADAMLAKLGKHSTGKGCLYIKRLSEVDLKVFEAMIAKAHANSKSRRSHGSDGR